MAESDIITDWEKCDTQVFWGEIAPCDHLLQIYENDDVVLNSLEGFVTSGIKAGDSVIVIATKDHLKALNDRLQEHGFNPKALRSMDQFIPVDAEVALSKFMIHGWPDEKLFTQMVTEVVTRAKGKNKRKVRAYGEMVAILWAQGNSGATVRLEHLWNRFCESEAFCLFCAYPKSGFTQDMHESIAHICSAHTKVIAGDVALANQVFYKTA